MFPSPHTPLIFRIPVWFKVDPTRNQKSVKQGLICSNFLFASWMDVCITNRNRHETAKADFIFSLQSQPNSTPLILSFSLQLGHVAVLFTAKRERKSLSIVTSLPQPKPPLSRVHAYSHIYRVKTQLQQ